MSRTRIKVTTDCLFQSKKVGRLGSINKSPLMGISEVAFTTAVLFDETQPNRTTNGKSGNGCHEPGKMGSDTRVTPLIKTKVHLAPDGSTM